MKLPLLCLPKTSSSPITVRAHVTKSLHNLGDFKCASNFGGDYLEKGANGKRIKYFGRSEDFIAESLSFRALRYLTRYPTLRPSSKLSCTKHVLYVWCQPPKLASRFTSAAFDSDDLAGLDGLEVSEASGHERNEVFQEDRFTKENNHRNLPMSEVLLVFKSAIHGQENVEFRGLSCGQELTVLKSREASIPGGLTFVPGEIVAQSFAHTLVRRTCISSLGRQQLLSFLQRGDGHLA